MEKEKTVKYKSKKFAIRIVNLFKYLFEEKKETVMSKQLLKSDTSSEQTSLCSISPRGEISTRYVAPPLRKN